MVNSVDALIESLAVAGEADAEFYNTAFERYLTACPDSREITGHMDELMRGRMMEQVVGLLMEAQPEALDAYFRFEVANHESYGALPPMYAHLFEATREVTREACGAGWSPQAEREWQERIALLLTLIDKHGSAPTG